MLTGWVLAFIASGLLTCATIVPAAVAETLPMAQVAMGIGIVASGCVYGAVLYTAMWRPLALISNDLKAGRPVVPRCVATKEAARLSSALSIVSARSEALRLRRFLQEQPHHRSKPAPPPPPILPRRPSPTLALPLCATAASQTRTTTTLLLCGPCPRRVTRKSPKLSVVPRGHIRRMGQSSTVMELARHPRGCARTDKPRSRRL
jgi:hypothetical protein